MISTMLLSGQLADPNQQTDILKGVFENVNAAKGMDVAKETMSKLSEKLPENERSLLDALVAAKELDSLLKQNDKDNAGKQAKKLESMLKDLHYDTHQLMSTANLDKIIKKLEKELPDELVYVAYTLQENKAALNDDFMKGVPPSDT